MKKFKTPFQFFCEWYNTGDNRGREEGMITGVRNKELMQIFSQYCACVSHFIIEKVTNTTLNKKEYLMANLL